MEKIKTIIADSINVKNKILADDKLLQVVKDCVSVTVTAFQKGNKVLFCGNGGSAADHRGPPCPDLHPQQADSGEDQENGQQQR